MVSLYAGMIGLAVVAAPILGGVLVDADPLGLGWRSVFVVNLPVGAAALIGARKWMRESKSPHTTRLDLIGVLLAIVGLLLLMFPLMLGRELDWPAWSIASLVGAGSVMVGFVFYERFKTRRDGSSLVILSLFQVRAFSIGVFAQLLFSAVPAGFFLSWTLYLQGGLGWSALHTGLTAIPFSLGVPIVGTIAVRTIFPRFGRYSLVAGALMMILGIASYAWVAEHAGDGVTSWHVAPSMLLLGSGMGLLMAPLTGLILREVEPQEAGAASGVINTVGQLGAALGVAIIGGVFFSALAGNAGQQADKVIATVRAVAPAQAATLRTCATDQLGQADLTKVPASCATLLASIQDPSQNAGAGRQVINSTLSEIRSKTFIAAYSKALYWAAGGLVLIAGLLFLLPHHAHRLGPTASTPGEAP
ncbi:MFS transporter [Catenulispora yoronensis]